MLLTHGSSGPVRIAWAVVAGHAAADSASALEVVTRLGPSQRRRYESLDPARAARFSTGRRLMAGLLADLVPLEEVSLTSVCTHCGGDHGRPRVVGARVAVSVSYAGDMVAAAAVSLDRAGAIGIDIERGDDASAPLAGLTPLFAPDPPPDLREWTLIEASVKADGRGMRVPPSTVRLGEPSSSVLPRARAVRMPGRAQPLEAAPAPGPDGYVLSLAVVPAGAGRSPARTTER